MAMHDGHRQRLKDRFRQEGLDHFSDVQVLELLLFYCIPRIDTNPLAHRLLERFGSLAQVLEAPAADLEKVEGMGANAATFLSLITSVGRYYLVNRSAQNTILNTTEKCGNYLVSHFYGRRNETVFLLCLDAKCKLLCCREIGEGSVNSAGIPVRRIVETALAANATSVVLAHNHPSGLATPSPEDVYTTRRLAAALDTVEIVLVDHIVVADDDFVSLVQSGYYRPGTSTFRA
ncbi:MAG: DNA repair protein RadC [Ruminococcaceae bacterium]|nr:DNA repair protein RadC [Oscillospiraceae bacterium]